MGREREREGGTGEIEDACGEKNGFLVLLDLTGHFCFGEVMRSSIRSGSRLQAPGVVAALL